MGAVAYVRRRRRRMPRRVFHFRGKRGNKRVYRRKYSRRGIRRHRARVFNIKLVETCNQRNVQVFGAVATDAMGSDGGYLALTALNFRIDGCPDFARWSPIYNQFRINKIVVQYTYTKGYQDATFGSENAENACPRLFHCIRPDQPTVPGSLNEARVYPGMKEIPMKGKVFTHSVAFTPSCLLEGYEGTGATFYAPKYKQWMDVADPTTKFYGLIHGTWTPLTDNPPALTRGIIGTLACKVIFYVSFKDIKPTAAA